MKKKNGWLLTLVCLTGFVFFSCQKENLSSGSDLFLSNEQDTIRFDTVFTTADQITQKTKLFNRNSTDIKLSNISLAGGQSSPFKINVNGQSGSAFPNLTIEGQDSLYIFVTVNLPKGNKQTPLFYKDSILYHYNNQEGKILLYAYGQDAYFLSTSTINKDTTWNNDLPIVLDGNVTVGAGSTLHIEEGSRIYSKAGTGLMVAGTLKAIGGDQPGEQIVMTNNRMDEPYDELPGGWTGIQFGPNSSGNELQQVVIQNAITGITDTARTTKTSLTSLIPTLTLDGCQIGNSSKNAVHFRNAQVRLTNCLLYNASQLVQINGGSYNFTYCTLAGYTNDYIQHNEPLVSLNNTTNGEAANLSLTAINNIIYGDNESMDELDLTGLQTGSAKLTFDNCLIKNAQIPATGAYKQCIWGEDPGFAVIDNKRAIYDFQVLNGSAAIGAARVVPGVSFDLRHQNRSETEPTIGCLEFKN